MIRMLHFEGGKYAIRLDTDKASDAGQMAHGRG